MGSSLLTDFKKCVHSLRDKQGYWRDKPIGIVANAETNEDNIERLKTILMVLFSSDKISDETKLFLSDLSINMKETNEELNRLRDLVSSTSGKKLNHLSYDNTIKKIRADNESLTAIFGRDIIRDCVYNRLDSISQLDSRIDKFISEFGVCDKSRNNLLISIGNTEIGVNHYKNNEEFFDILKSIECYLTQRVNIIQKAINQDKEFVAYFNYLLSQHGIIDKSAHTDRERLIKFLNNEDYTTGYNNADDSDCDNNEYNDSNNVESLSDSGDDSYDGYDDPDFDGIEL